MYGSNNIQATDLIVILLAIVEKGEKKTKLAVQLEADFQTDTERKLFYSNYNRKDEEEHISLNHQKVPTIYCPPKFRNMLAVHLLSALSSEPYAKYLTTGFQQKLVPAPGSCIAFEPKISFTAYLTDTGHISVISESSTPIDLVQLEQFHSPLKRDNTSHLFISPYNTVSKILR